MRIVNEKNNVIVFRVIAVEYSLFPGEEGGSGVNLLDSTETMLLFSHYTRI